MAALLSLVLMVGNHSFAASTCGDASVIQDPAVEYGVEILNAKIAEANFYGDVKTRLEPATQIVKSKNKEAISLMRCLAAHGKIKLNVDTEALKQKLNEIERLERQTTLHGGRLNPTQEEIRIVDSAIGAMKLNRLAKAYLANFIVVEANK